MSHYERKLVIYFSNENLLIWKWIMVRGASMTWELRPKMYLSTARKFWPSDRLPRRDQVSDRRSAEFITSQRGSLTLLVAEWPSFSLRFLILYSLVSELECSRSYDDLFKDISVGVSWFLMQCSTLSPALQPAIAGRPSVRPIRGRVQPVRGGGQGGACCVNYRPGAVRICI